MSAANRTSVLIVGGPDVDKRLDLMAELAPRFDVSAAGSDERAAEGFARARFPFYGYPLARTANPFADLRTLFALVRLMRRVRPDIVHAFATKPAVWGRIAAHLARIPVVIGTIPGLGSLFAPDSGRSGLTRAIYLRLQKMACGWSDLTIFQNHSDRDRFVAEGLVEESRTRVILSSGVRTAQYGPDTDRSAAAGEFRRSIEVPENAIIVTMVSRLIRPKGVIEFARAARELRHKHPSTEFLLVGPDDQESIHRLEATELQEVVDSVSWLGERGDVPTILAATDVFVLPSYYPEGVPRVLLEAAASGVPMVTTAAPGCAEVVQDGVNGFLIPVERLSTELAEALGRLVEDEHLRSEFGRAARAVAVERFDLSLVARQTAEVYGSLVVAHGVAVDGQPGNGGR